MNTDEVLKEVRDDIKDIKDNHLHAIEVKVAALATEMTWIKWLLLSLVGGGVAGAGFTGARLLV